jgi:hypothetical protein
MAAAAAAVELHRARDAQALIRRGSRARYAYADCPRREGYGFHAAHHAKRPGPHRPSSVSDPACAGLADPIAFRQAMEDKIELKRALAQAPAKISREVSFSSS